jgi:hypothetical protein
VKKFLLQVITFSLMFLATACTSSDSTNSGSKIVSPVNNLIPIAGTWKVQSYKLPEENNLNKSKPAKWLNSIASFSATSATLGEDYCKNPTYKVKVVNTSSYLLYGYKQKADYLNINQSQVQIITISSENNFFHEFIKVNDELIITNIDGVFLYLKKTSNRSTQNPESSTLPLAEGNISPSLNSPSSKSLLLIGLRSSTKSISSTNENLGKNYNYRTLLISYSNKKLNPVLETKNLFVPRMTGFWSLNVDRLTNNFESIDFINAFPSGTKQKDTANYNITNNERKVINFIGNDYISIEKTSQVPAATASSSVFSSYLQVLPLDNINSKESIKISQLTDQAGVTAIKEGATAYLNSINNNTNFSKDFSEYNWGIFRRNGHWILKGRLTTFNATSTSIPPDFYIPIPAPKKNLVGYDDLYPTWSSIKDRVPDAIDAFSSPSKDILITISNTILSVYELKNNNIALSPLAQIKFKENETVIMDQWAQGDYTEAWTKAFNKNIVTEPTMVKIN